ncbi:hypothetical protein D9757_008992 [Collybiopsis confluens]|uniref:MFS general substrate transporter n=1 Tax=Collybiopsis confluens TaxID=2823264 RepID=A0A8H5H331_9AGAR|nr:hypothetical protein D9757_008992 [Collybiopsis confluens]
MSSDEIELAARTPLPPSTSNLSFSTSDNNSEVSFNHAGRNQPSLPPMDKGRQAWSFLIAAFVVQAVVWGFPTSSGIFLKDYLSDPTYASQPNASKLLPLIGPVGTGIIYCSGKFFFISLVINYCLCWNATKGPLINPIITRYPHHKRTSLYIGSMLCFVSLFAASYTTRIVILVSLLGALYAIGGSLLYFPCLSYLSEWFHHKRGFASGAIFAGTAVGGFVLPLILPPLISAYGPPKTLRILSVATSILLIPLLPFVKGRLPVSQTRSGPSPRGRGNREWLKSRSFWVLVVANTLQGFGYFVPIVWLPTFAGELGLNSTKSSIALILLNLGSLLGRLSMGYLSDKVNPWLLAFLTLISTSAATFILWGVLSYSLPGLLTFGLVYGTLAGGWSSSWNGFMKPLTANDPNLSATLFAVLLFSRGMGNVFSTPISTALLGSSNSTSSSLAAISTSSASFSPHPPHSIHDFDRIYTTGTGSADLDFTHLGFHVGGGRFEKMILYVGTCFAAAAMVALGGWGVEVIQRIRMTGIAGADHVERVRGRVVDSATA